MLAWIVFVAYLIAVAVIGYYGARKTKTVADFVAASGQLGFWTYSLLMIGSVFSGMTLIGVAGLAFTTGWANMWERIIGPAFAIAFGTIIIGSRLFKIKANGILTIQDYLAFRYNDPKIMRVLAGVVSALTCYIYLIGQYTAIGVASQIILGIPYWLGATIAALIVVFYVMGGGMFSTAWTTFLQSLLMMLGIYITVPVIIAGIGGFEQLNMALSNMPQLQNETRGVATNYMFAEYLSKPFAPANVPLAGWVYNITLFFITVPLGLMVAPHIVNNMLTFRDRSYIKWSPLVMYLLGVMIILLTAIAGMAARVAWAQGTLNIPELDLGVTKVTWSDMAYPAIAQKFLPEWLFLLLLPTILAGVMSTTDRLILTATNNISYDIVKNALGKDLGERKMRIFNAFLVAFIGFSSLLIALTPQQMLAWIIWSGLGLMANCFFFPIILGLYWSGMTKNAARLSMLVGLVVTIVCFAIYGKTIPISGIPAYAAFPGFLASFMTALIVSLAEKKS